jgi:PIN domain nuclease of toxin-antitoxin system
VILLDTHVLIWMAGESKRLSRAASQAIRAAEKADGVAISAISLWELATLFARGRIRAYGTVEASVQLVTQDVIVKPITPEIASLAAQFPDDFPHDPADRLIGATARAYGLKLVTRDARIAASPLLQAIW